MLLHEIDEDGNYSVTESIQSPQGKIFPNLHIFQTIRLGDPFVHPGSVFTYFRRANFWMSAELDSGSKRNKLNPTDGREDAYCLVKAMTVPAFDWACFDPISRQEFAMKFPRVPSFPQDHFVPDDKIENFRRERRENCKVAKD